MIHTLFVEKGLGEGGSALSLKCLIDALDRKQFRPFLLFSDSRAATDKFEWSPDVRILKLADRNGTLSVMAKSRSRLYLLNIYEFIFKSIPYMVKLIKLMREESIGLVHFNNDIDSHLSGMIACKAARIPFVCHLRSTRKLTKTEKMFSKFIPSYIALSEEGRAFYIKEGIPARAIVVSGDPYDTSLRQTADRGPAWLVGMNGEVKVGICSRIAKGKGHETLLKAAAQVIRRNRNVHFVIMGDEANDTKGYLDTLKELVAKLGIGDHVTFTGWQTDIRGSLQAIDILVDPSYLPEGLRRTIVEAMLEGKPVIATDVGQTRHLIVESQGGFLMMPHDAEGLSASIEQLLNDKELRNKMGQQARDYAVERFDMYKKAREIESIYEGILK